MAATRTGRGYWLVASDGGIFSFGDARFHGSTGATPLNQPIVGIAATPTGHGYWLVASDGGIFGFGSARFYGSAGAASVTAPVTGMASTPSGHGYRIATRDGRVFDFGDASHLRRAAGPAPGNVVAIVSGLHARGYWLAAADASANTESAIAWFESRIGSRAYEGLCETAVEVAFGTTQAYPTAPEIGRTWHSTRPAPPPDRHRTDRLLPEPAGLGRLALVGLAEFLEFSLFFRMDSVYSNICSVRSMISTTRSRR